ncbi:uncharacterized protein B0I36DRAFT_412585 [Microdochium trichocladiopsis]|uniref:Polyketide synthase n=1 Tax=Microdochium trichocladiopsis TaxID=1682393 RepID=A0A9P8Y3D1_9PEZI|nr:uncharacterized protein B0I36DRAFT_412585 [Microdochium trichocladiopsis]KAH7027192.1 hypothetical protein B0I36DRAFT_412585 [Microdochium trichocladiopsis]
MPKPAPSEPIAIIGIACRFAGGVECPEDLWNLCASGKDSWSSIPEDRFNALAWYDPEGTRDGRHNIKGGYFLNRDVSHFDAAFFNLPGDVASSLDPQIRMLLEVTYESMEDAGLPLDKLAGSNTSVYTGTFNKDYHEMQTSDPEMMPHYFAAGTGTAMLSNRISYSFDLRGPSFSLDTGCSSGMVAFHQGCESIRTGQCDMSIVTAANLMLHQDSFIGMSNLSATGADGRCYAWDARASGYGRGEGVASLILKPLSAAQRDGDQIHAVIIDSGLNQDGKTTTISSPSMDAQVTLIRECYQRAGLDMADTAYVEAHMTGTPAGDPVEAEALARTFGASRRQKSNDGADDVTEAAESLLVGSVKTNVGHTEPVSGLAAILKTIYVLKHGVIPPNLNYETPHPSIPLQEWRLRVPTSVTPWPKSKALRASVNNFGYGGTNGHVIMEAAPAAREAREKQSRVYVVSAKDSSAVKSMAANLASFLRKALKQHASIPQDDAAKSGEEGAMLALPNSSDLAYTLSERRSLLPWVIAVRASNLEELADRLEDPVYNRPAHSSKRAARIGFVFNGQGAQWHAMGRELIFAYSEFEHGVRRAEEALKDLGAGWSLYDELTLRDETTTRVSDVDLSQSMTVAVQICLVDLLRSWGIHPTAMTSHSSGEIAAAYAAGAVSFREALGIAYCRGAVALEYLSKHHDQPCTDGSVEAEKQQQKQGGMLAAGLSAEAAEEYVVAVNSSTVDGELSPSKALVACINSPTSVTLSGDVVAIEQLATKLNDDGVFNRRLKVPMAYHSHHMLDLAAQYTEMLRDILRDDDHHHLETEHKDILFSSPVTGGLLHPNTARKTLRRPEHWALNMTNPVLFSQAFEDMCFGSTPEDAAPGSGNPSKPQQANVDVILEIGAHSTLSGPIRQILKARGGNTDLPYVSCLKRPVSAVETMQSLVCSLIGHGYPVSLSAVNSPATATTQHKFVTGLPAYPWNHASRYWVEPRISRELRHQAARPHELLGTRMPGTAGNSPTWRNLLRLADVPWLQHHQVDSQIVVPGAAYLSMAIEAIRRLLPGGVSEAGTGGYKLRNVEIMNALVVPDGSSSSSSASSVETQLTLRKCDDKVLDHQGWYDFEVSSLGPSSSSWVENCRGGIALEKADVVKVCTAIDVVVPDERTYLDSDNRLDAASGGSDGEKQRQQHHRKVDLDAMFADLRERGIHHTPPFQNLTDSTAASCRAVTNLVIPDLAFSSSSYMIHPTTLDSIFLATYSSLPQDMDGDVMVLPRSIRSMYVPRDLGREGGDKLVAFTELTRSNRWGCTSNAIVVNKTKDDDNAVFQMKGFFGQAVLRHSSRAVGGNEDDQEQGGMCAKSCWEPDMLHNIPASFAESMRVELEESEAVTERRIVLASFYLIHDAVVELERRIEAGTTSPASWPWHHQKFFAWMQGVVERADRGELGSGSEQWKSRSRGMQQMLIDEMCADQDPSGHLVARVGEKLAAIVAGDVTSPLELMMEGGLLHEYYEHTGVLTTRTYRHLGRVAELFAVKNPGAHVLEIGGGTGGATRTVLEAFAAKREAGLGGSLIGSYTFTDISSGFFPAAKKKLEAWGSVVQFRQLDIEQDPALAAGPGQDGDAEYSQPLRAGGYDLIVACGVLHATKNLTTTMTHVRKLLKHGGKLLMIEMTRDRLTEQLIFGTLPGWWLAEEPYRQGRGPNASVAEWDAVLKEVGFDGVAFEKYDFEEEEFQHTNVLLSTAIEPSRRVRGPISIVHRHPVGEAGSDNKSSAWTHKLIDEIESKTGIRPIVESLEQAAGNAASARESDGREDMVYIMTAEMEQPLTADMDEATFGLVRRLLLNTRGVLWLSCSSAMDGLGDPAFSATQGLLRTLRHEDSSSRCVHLDFARGGGGGSGDDGNVWRDDQVAHVVHVLAESFTEGVDAADVEWEYAARGGALYVPRIYPDKVQDAAALAQSDGPTLAPEPELFRQPGRPLQCMTAKTGLLGDMFWTDKAGITGVPVPAGMVEVEARAFGINFRDVMLGLNQLDNSLVGHEAAGIVTRLGPGAGEASGLALGDRVCVLPWGMYASTAQADWTNVCKIPEGMSFEDAASIPLTYVTAYNALVQIARMQPTDSILIHAATGGVGQAAIVLAQHFGVATRNMYVTCSSEAKRRLLVDEYGILPHNIFSSRDTSFVQGVMAATRGRGVDIVLNSLSGALLGASWDCVARFGRFLEIGKVDLEAGRGLEMTPFGRCAVYAGVDILQLGRYDGALMRDALLNSVRICHERSLASGGAKRPAVPITVFPIADMERAMRQMQGGSHMGKLVLVPGEGDMVRVVSRPQPVSLANPDATYLIVGGLTGIGQAIAEWMMVEKGAQNLVLASRNAASHPDAGKMHEIACRRGCNLAIRDCDIADEQSLVALLAEFSSSPSLPQEGQGEPQAKMMPPIRGVVNAAMVLDDTVFERMTYAQWTRAVRPKIAGSYNLHKHLPSDLSFFILLSSLTGVAGHTSQANYAAGNTFQDALARHRTAHGQAAVSLDLGAVESVGYIVEQMEKNKDGSVSDNVRDRFASKFGFSSIGLDVVLRLVEQAIRDPLRARPDLSQVIVGLSEIAGGNNKDKKKKENGRQSAEQDYAAARRDRRFGTLALADRRDFDGAQNKSSSAAGGKSRSSNPTAALIQALTNLATAVVDPSLPLSHYGVDSLVAVELRNWLGNAAKAKVTIFEILQSASIAEFAGVVAGKSDLVAAAVAASAGSGAAA